MKWTIGMPSYNNFAEVFFTVNSLRFYHDMTDKEIVVIDNYGNDKTLKEFCQKAGVKYYLHNAVQGVSYAKNKIFEVATGENVLCIDSHILVLPGAFDYAPKVNEFVQGPCVCNDGIHCMSEWLPEWRSEMWGVWAPLRRISDLPAEPWEIWAQGAGYIAVKRDKWLGFNKKFTGFGAETGYIQEKYRQAGFKVLCHPKHLWVHLFGRRIPYPLRLKERIQNYLYAFEELGLDTAPVHDAFGEALVKSIKARMK